MTALTETIEALEYAVEIVGSMDSEEAKADAALLSALAKALRDLTSEEYWIELAPFKFRKDGIDAAKFVRERLERP